MHPLPKKEHAHFEQDFGAQRLKKDRGSELKEVVTNWSYRAENLGVLQRTMVSQSGRIHLFTPGNKAFSES